MNIEEQIKLSQAKTYVFWDIVDFPLHGEAEIDSFYRSVKSSLQEEGYYGEISIAAYGHRDPDIPKMMESVHPEIHLQRRTSRFARLNNLLVDMVDYTRMNPLANLMLIMKYTPEDEDIELVRIVNEVKKRNYNVFLVVGDNQDRDNCGYPSDVLPGCTIWTWTSLVSGGPPCTSDYDDDEEDDGEDDGEDDDDSDHKGSSHKRQKIIDDAGSASIIDDAGSASILCGF